MLGYSSNVQREQLSKKTSSVMNALYFVEKHWKALLYVDFPSITTGDDFSGSIHPESLRKTKQKGNTQKKKRE